MMKKLMMAVAGVTSAVAMAAEPVSYLDWDDANGKMTNATLSATDYELVTSGTREFEDGKWYVVAENVVIDNGGKIKVNGSARLILCDNASLTIANVGNSKAAIDVSVSGSVTNELTIYGQQGGSGVLMATGGLYGAGIGSDAGGAGGTVTINGGTVTAQGDDYAAGIGGGRSGAGGTVTINGGIVTATGGNAGAGIGGGARGAGGIVTINGGSVTATGGDSGAGIGGGTGGAGGTVTVNGGSVTANGSHLSAGIGGGAQGAGGIVTVNGGTVTATGGKYGAGIGGGDNGADGTVTLGKKAVVVEGAVGNGSSYVKILNTDDYPIVTVGVFEHMTAVWTSGDGSVTNAVSGTSFMVKKGMDNVKVIFTAQPNYEIPGDPVVRLDGAVTECIVFGEGNDYVVPTVRCVFGDIAYLDWDDMEKKMTNATLSATDYELVTSGTREFADGKWYVVAENVVIDNGGNIKVNGSARLIFCDDASLTIANVGNGKAAIDVSARVSTTNSLTIYGQQGGSGVLMATGGLYGAGIGGGAGGAGGTVTINGGSVTATGGDSGAGIGGGRSGAGGNITINDGLVTATGGENGAGIGGGDNGADGTVTLGKNVEVAEGAVGNGSSYVKIVNTDDYPTVTVGVFEHMTAAWTSGDGSVTNAVSGTSFRVKKGTDNVKVIFTAQPNYEIPGDPVVRLDGAVTENIVFGVGNDYAVPAVRSVLGDIAYLDWDATQKKLVETSTTDYIVYNGETALAAGTTYVVKGDVTNRTAITVNGTEENPTYLILCDGAKLTASEGVLVQVNGATTNALVICGQTDGTGAFETTGGYYGAGIGGGYNYAGGTVTINGGSVTATGGYGGAGIGGGYKGAGGTVTINGGTVTATGGQNGAGVGGGYKGAGGAVTINGGSVTATGGEYGAGIGGGRYGAEGEVIKGDNVEVVEGAVGNGSSYAKILNVNEYLTVTVGVFEHMTAAWTSGNGAVTNAIGNTFFWVKKGTTNAKVIFTPEHNYRFVDVHETGVRALESPLKGSCEATPPQVEKIPGTVINPWKIGKDVTAYIEDRILYLKGDGAVNEFASAADAPWAGYGEVLEGVGPLSKGIVIPASVLATLPISVAGVPPVPVPPAGAVTTWAALTNAVATYPTPTAPEGSATMGAESGAVIAVGADINEPDGVLTIAKEHAVTILLYGKVVSCQKVVVEGALTVGAEDDSVGKIVAAEGAQIGRAGSVTLLGGPLRGTFTAKSHGLALLFK